MQGSPKDESDEAAAAFGVTLLPAEDEVVETDGVWPECWQAVRLFDAIRTQWRCGPGGAVGLDYSVIPLLERSLRIPRRERRGLLEDLQVMEYEALLMFSESRKNDH